MPTQELTITYGSYSVGAATGRLITGWTRSFDEYETAWIEFEFILTAATDALFATGIAAARAAYREPRLALTVTQNGESLLSLSQSANTGFDAAPSIVKDGDPADTGRSRHFKVRIEFGRPADNVSTSFRRYSTVTVEYLPSRQRRVTISGVYTANSTDGTTGSFAQYRAQIDSYATTVLSGISSTASFERVGEPNVTRNETDKVTNFSAVYLEILYRQGGSTDIDWVVDPVLTVTIEREAPGDSTSGRLSVAAGSGTSGGTIAAPSTSNQGDTVERPRTIMLNYSCAVDYTIVAGDAIQSKYQSVLRTFLVAQGVSAFGTGSVVLVSEKPGWDKYTSRLTVEMRFLAYRTNITKMRVTVNDDTDYARVLVGVYSKDVFEYYDYPGSAIRLRTVEEEYEQRVGTSNAGSIVDGLVKGPGSVAMGYGSNWVMRRRFPKTFIERVGIPGGGGTGQQYIAHVTVITILQFRKRLSSTKAASAGQITGVNIST